MNAPTLPPAPQLVNDAAGAPRFGTFEGSLEAVNLRALRPPWQPERLQRLAMHKKWFYTFVATREVAALFAVVDLGYSSNAFALAIDYGTQRVLADVGVVGLPAPQVEVNAHVGAGLQARFRSPGVKLRAWRHFGDERYHLEARLGLGAPLRKPKLTLQADLLAAGAGQPLPVIAPGDKGIVNVTQKWAGLLTSGFLEAGGRRYSLDGGVGGVDSTHGYLARRTAWRWAFVCGRLDDGRALGINLVEGFNEARDDVNENALWLGSRLVPLGRARFSWNRDDVLDRWQVTTTDGVLELTFKPIAVHKEVRDLVFVRSRFLQPVGLWSGTIRLDDQVLRFEGAPGVAEDQSVVW